MLYRVVEENLRVAMRCYARVNELGEARDYPGISVAYCGLGCAVFNSALLNAPADQSDLKRAVDLAGVHFRQRGVGWTFWLCEDLLADSLRRTARSLVCDAGLDPIAQPPGLYAEKLDPPRRPPANLTIRKVQDAATRLDFAHLSSVIFSLPFGVARSIYDSETLWEWPMTGYLGYLNDQAVSLASVVIGAGAAGVYSLGTLPGYQGRGFAETIVRHGLREAREINGNEVTVLQSTAQGLSLYTRMGYRPVTRFGVYITESWRRN